ncbi:MAG: ROK family protein [Chitinophagaceae bacterium]|nr:MAG: ROK family protein [Chitinophagaceae bacterium]
MISSVLGVDIGGSHITAALVDLNSRSVVPGSRRRKQVNSQGSADEIIRDWAAVMEDAFGNTPKELRKIGIAMPGPFDYEEGVSLIKEQNKFNALYQLNVRHLLAEGLGIESDRLRFINDAAGFLQGEVFCGAGQDEERVLGFTLGTGLGSAICVAGVATDAGLWSTPFKEGIAEDYLSTRWFVQRYNELSGLSVSGVKELLTGNQSLVNQIFMEFTEHLGIFLEPVIRKHEARTVVFGGNISHAHNYFLPTVKRLLAANGINVTLKPAQLNEDAALLGAASSWQIPDYQSGDK